MQAPLFQKQNTFFLYGLFFDWSQLSICYNIILSRTDFCVVHIDPHTSCTIICCPGHKHLNFILSNISQKQRMSVVARILCGSRCLRSYCGEVGRAEGKTRWVNASSTTCILIVTLDFT
jgi:hypothetical protein